MSPIIPNMDRIKQLAELKKEKKKNSNPFQQNYLVQVEKCALENFITTNIKVRVLRKTGIIVVC